MRVHFEMSGGYGGLFVLEPLEVDVDSASLPDDERVELQKMASAAMACKVASPDETSLTRDQMTYRLQIIDDVSWEAEMEDGTIPDDVVPLIDYMRHIAVRSRMDSE